MPQKSVGSEEQGSGGFHVKISNEEHETAIYRKSPGQNLEVGTFFK